MALSGGDRRRAATTSVVDALPSDAGRQRVGDDAALQQDGRRGRRRVGRGDRVDHAAAGERDRARGVEVVEPRGERRRGDGIGRRSGDDRSRSVSTSVSAGAMTAKVMSSDPSAPTVAWTRARAGAHAREDTGGGVDRRGGVGGEPGDRVPTLSPSLSSGRAESWIDSPTSTVSGPATRTSMPTTPASPSSSPLQPSSGGRDQQAEADAFTSSPGPGCWRCRAGRSRRGGPSDRRRVPWAAAPGRRAGGRPPAARRPA